jgi:hypothetical protein
MPSKVDLHSGAGLYTHGSILTPLYTDDYHALRAARLVLSPSPLRFAPLQSRPTMDLILVHAMFVSFL